MSGDCYIFADALPPCLGWQPRPAGLRAEQLAVQARGTFRSVKTVVFSEWLNRLRVDRGHAVLAAAHPDVVVIALDDFGVFVDRLPPSTLVFTCPDFAEQAEHAAVRHTIVYDIARPQIAALLQSGAPADEVEKAVGRHNRMLKLAKRTLVGVGDEAEFLGASAPSVTTTVNPLAPPVAKEADNDNAGDAPGVSAGSSLVVNLPPERLFDTGPMLRAVNAYLSGAPETPVILLGPPAEREAPQTLEHSALLINEHVTALTNPSVVNRAEAIGTSFGLIEWVPEAPTGNGASATVLEAIAAGVPVLHQMGTALDRYFSEFPGMLVEGEIDQQSVNAFCESARSGAYGAALEAARAQLAAWRADSSMFAGLH